MGQRHIRVSFGPTFERGSLSGRQALAKYPLTFDDNQNPTSIYLFWTDSKGIIRKGAVKLQDIMPAEPKKKNLQVMLLEGSHCGEVVQVVKVVKAMGKAFVKALTQSGVPWEEPFSNVCIVEDHSDLNCAVCSKWVN